MGLDSDSAEIQSNKFVQISRIMSVV